MRGRQRGRRGRAGLAGAAVAITLVVAGVGAILGRAADGAPRAAGRDHALPSFITAPIQRGRLEGVSVLRAQLRYRRTARILAPSNVGGDRPIVTGFALRASRAVQEGEVVASVAERPVIAMSGKVPAFRTMTFGMTGVDVLELQDSLHVLRLSTGGDASGSFGIGTAAAVGALYARTGFPPVLGSPVTIERAVNGRKVVRRRLATVPLGEVAFLPTLPARVVKVEVGLGGAVPASGTLASISTGGLGLTAMSSPQDASAIRIGERGRARSDLTTGQLRVRVTAVTASRGGGASGEIRFAPAGPVPAKFVGQNLAITVRTARARRDSLVVPLAAVNTDAAGRASITVLLKHGRRRVVDVRPGLISGGSESVGAPRGVHPGEAVIVGVITS